MVNALASDIDGTLYFRGETPPIKVKDISAIKKFQLDNHLFGLCSGRNINGVLSLNVDFKPDFYIAISGAVILDKDKNIIFDKPFNDDLISEIYYRYKDICDISIITNSFTNNYKTKNEHENDNAIIFKDLNEITDKVKYGISLVFEDDSQATHYCQMINQEYFLIEGFQNKNSIDIVSKGCSKGAAIDFIKEYFKIERIAGIGDSYNDVSMLEAADISFTFHSSPNEIKNNVHHLVDGIAEAIDIILE